MFSELPRIQRPAPALTRLTGEESIVLSVSLRSISLSPVELPCRVRVMLPPVTKPTFAVLLKTSAALFWAPAAKTLFPY